jgi:hypothetical protein
MKQSKTDGDDADACKASEPIFSPPAVKCALDKSAEKGFFGNTDKDQVFKEPNEGDNGDFGIPFDEIEMQ